MNNKTIFNGIGIDRRNFIVNSLATASVLYFGKLPNVYAQSATDKLKLSTNISGVAVDSLERFILKISHDVWSHPELPLHEEISSQIHKKALTESGFKIISTGTSGIPTAFIAEWVQGTGGG